MKIVPRGKNLLIKQQEEESRESEYGIILPNNVEQEKKATGKVLAIGKEVKDIKVGDNVIYGLFLGEKVKIKEKGKEVEYVLLREEDVIAFLV